MAPRQKPGINRDLSVPKGVDGSVHKQECSQRIGLKIAIAGALLEGATRNGTELSGDLAAHGEAQSVYC